MMSDSSPTVLAIGAHPDDVEFLGVGTLKLLSDRGWRISIATFTPGDCGSSTLPREEIARIRQEEARRSAALLGAEYACLEAEDLCVYFGDDLCRRATALLRSVRPDVVLTHPPADYLADHEEASRIVRQACFAASVRNYAAAGPAGQPPAPPTERVPHLYYFDPVEGTDLFGRPVEPALVVDISSVIETKERCLAQHESQRSWLRAQHGCDDTLEQMRAWSRERGAASGFAFAEGFRQHLGHAFPKTDRLGSALGALARAIR